METNKYGKYGAELWNLIDEIIDYKMENITTVKSARVVKVNADTTVDIVIPPTETVYHNVQNQTIYDLQVGDCVKVIKENNKLSNMWIIGGFNLHKYRWEKEE